VVSNFETFAAGVLTRADNPGDSLAVSAVRVRRPELILTGDREAVSREERRALLDALRGGLPATEIRQRLGVANAAASRASISELISEGCNTGSLHTSGSGESTPFLTDAQGGDFIPPETAAMLTRAGLELKAGTDAAGRPTPVRVVGSTTKRYNPSHDYFKREFERDPENAQTWNNYGSWLVTLGRLVEAMDAWRRALEIEPNRIDALSNLAKFSGLAGDDARAREQYEQLLDAHAEDVIPTHVLYEYAEVLARSGDIEGARSMFERAASDKSNPIGAARLALFLVVYADEVDRGLETLDRLVVANARNDEVHRIAARAHFHLQDYERAVYLLYSALASAPRDTDVMRDLSDALIGAGRLPESLPYLARLLKRDQQNGLLHAAYGLGLLAAGKTDGALRHLGRAARSAEDPGHRINLAAAIAASGDPARAVTMLERLKQSGLPDMLALEVAALLAVLVTDAQRRQSYLHEIDQLTDAGVRADATTVAAVGRSTRDARTETLAADLARQIRPMGSVIRCSAAPARGRAR
jgi:tetratricopeptide (TPR) repeat protein